MIGVISVTSRGDEIAGLIKEGMDIKLFSKNTVEDFNLSNVTKYLIENCGGVIFITSVGIAVRAIAPFLKGKDKDPGVVVVDYSNKYTISLVGGHLGGANDLALKVSRILENQPIITTATDTIGVVAPDILAKEEKLIIEDLKKAKYIASRLVEREKVFFKDDREKVSCPKGYEEAYKPCDNMVWITNRIHDINIKNQGTVLRLIPKNIVLGIGCRKNMDSNKLIQWVTRTLEENNIDKRAVLKIGSVDIKKQEKAINDLALLLNCPFETFSREEISKVDNKYEGSDFVFKTLGVRAVSEPSVELMGGTILKGKLKHEGITLTIGEIV